METPKPKNPPSLDPSAERAALQSRAQIKTLRTWGSLSHLFSIVVLILGAVMLLPVGDGGVSGLANQETQVVQRRQLLLEGLDKIVRYQHYYRELQGGFTRDLARLGMPLLLSHGDFNELHADYEVSVLEASDKRLIVLAAGKNDRVTMDDRYRVTANFILPPAHKKYLLEEADRILQLSSFGQTNSLGLYTNYWKAEARSESEGLVWSVVGQRAPVVGQRLELRQSDGRGPASIFSDVGTKLRSKLGEQSEVGKAELLLTTSQVRTWLQRLHLAQHIYKRENGVYASTFEQLASRSSFDLQKYSGALRVSPIEISPTGYRVSAEGLTGDILGEQFVMDQTGQVKQIRYTESIISKLQESSQILQGALPFQITEVGSETPAILDSKNTPPVKFNIRGPSSSSTP